MRQIILRTIIFPILGILALTTLTLTLIVLVLPAFLASSTALLVYYCLTNTRFFCLDDSIPDERPDLQEGDTDRLPMNERRSLLESKLLIRRLVQHSPVPANTSIDTSEEEEKRNVFLDVDEDTRINRMEEGIGGCSVSKDENYQEDKKSEPQLDAIETRIGGNNDDVCVCFMGDLVVEDMCCSICLNAYEQDDLVGFSNNCRCRHRFHRQCILEWLVQQSTCPICREIYVEDVVCESLRKS